MDSNEQNILDLDALAPQSRQIKLPGGEMVTIKPPQMKNLLRLGFLGDKLRTSGTDTTLEQIDKILSEMHAELVLIIPELKDVDLLPAQLHGVVNFVQEMGMSSTDKIMAKQEIEPAKDDNSPKAPA